MNTKTISTLTLVFLITGAIDSVRNLPTSALFGTSLCFFFIVAAVLFLIPVALISASLSAKWPEHGGIYAWVRLAFGEKLAFLAIWFQWINTLIWLPTILSFIAGTAAFLIDPALGHNKIYLTVSILMLYWLLTWINVKGIHVSARVSSICAIIGMLLPITFIMVLGLVWLLTHKPLQIHLSWLTLIPNFSKMDSWVSLTAIITCFLGLELASVHIRSVNNPQKTFPKALAISTLLIMVTTLFGALTIAFVLPIEKISLVNGVAETFQYFLQVYNLAWLFPYVIAIMLLGCYGGIISWIISPVQGVLQAVEYGYMPPSFAKKNKHGVPVNLLLLQAGIVSVFSLVFLFVPSVNSIYWLLTDLSTELYIFMYVLMFFAALKLNKTSARASRIFRIPGGDLGFFAVCALGFIGCAIGIFVGFFPPAGISSVIMDHYKLIFASVLILMNLPVFLFYYYRKFHYTKPARIAVRKTK